MNKYHLSLIVTNQCNLRCTYCYESTKNKKRMSFDTAVGILRHFLNHPDYDEVEIDFFGGEPFLEFTLIKKICEWVWANNWKNKYVFFATTNGTKIHGEIAEWLRLHRKDFWVSLSLDGRPNTHNRNRSNSYSLINIPFFKENWPAQTIKMTISKESVYTLYEDIVFIHSLGFNITGTNFAEGINWEDSKFVDIVHTQLEKLCEYYISHPEIKPCPLINMPIFKCEDGNSYKKWCGCGENMGAYDTDGHLWPCTFFTPLTFSDEELSNVSELKWNDYSKFVDSECKDNCYLYPICNNCYGANLLSTGYINKHDRSKCKLMEKRALFAAIYHAHRLKTEPAIQSRETALTIDAIEKIYSLYND